jgi:hypothetical protein
VAGGATNSTINEIAISFIVLLGEFVKAVSERAQAPK